MSRAQKNRSATRFDHLGVFSDLVKVARKANNLWQRPAPGEKTRRRFRDALHFEPRAAKPIDARVEGRWERDGVAGEIISWSVGYGPRTEAWLLKPAGAPASQRLPGIVALHDHSGFKVGGKEKIADGPNGHVIYPQAKRDLQYGGRAFSNALAREGFAVLVHDTFLWGSRRFPYETITPGERALAERIGAEADPNVPIEVAQYNTAAAGHEHIVEKYCRVLGTTMAGIVSFEDRVAANYLLSRKDVKRRGVGCVGLSGGGMRAILLQATAKEIIATVSVGGMCTYEGLLDHNVHNHTWMFYPGEWPLIGDWSDAAACRAPSPLMVQSTLQDKLYTPEGMKAAQRRIAAHYRSVGASENYEGRLYSGHHKFDLPMQADAFEFLKKHHH